MEFKGTKGKWYLQEYSDAYTNIIRVKTDTHDGIFLGSTSQNPNPEYRANAKLIASAPELLEALQEIQIDLSILKSNFIQIEKTDSRAEGMTNIIDKWIERNKKAIEKALK